MKSLSSKESAEWLSTAATEERKDLSASVAVEGGAGEGNIGLTKQIRKEATKRKSGFASELEVIGGLRCLR